MSVEPLPERRNDVRNHRHRKGPAAIGGTDHLHGIFEHSRRPEQSAGAPAGNPSVFWVVPYRSVEWSEILVHPQTSPHVCHYGPSVIPQERSFALRTDVYATVGCSYPTGERGAVLQQQDALQLSSVVITGKGGQLTPAVAQDSRPETEIRRRVVGLPGPMPGTFHSVSGHALF